jgi:hypothetical protein
VAGDVRPLELRFIDDRQHDVAASAHQLDVIGALRLPVADELAVMPFARSTLKSLGVVDACVCMSRKPGTTYLPLPSTSAAVPLTFTLRAVTCVILPASTTTAMPRERAPSRVFTTVAFWMTVPFVMKSGSPLPSPPPPPHAPMIPTMATARPPPIKYFFMVLDTLSPTVG